jgi:hypothetical protein
MRTTCTILLVLLVAFPVAAQRPLLISYQGLLTNTSGTPIPDGSVTLNLALYQVAEGGSAVWSETQTVEITSGLLTVYLGADTPLSQDLFDDQLWLGIAIDADPEMVPRTLLGVAPYAAAPYDTTELGGLGLACSDGSECLSGFCSDGVCCDEACGDGCETCDGLSPGTCETLPAGWPDAACFPYLCDEAGLCETSCTTASDCVDEFTFYCDSGSCLTKKSDGNTCASSAECLSGNCPLPDGVCCSTACAGTCESCSLLGSEGSCGLTPAFTDPDDECVAGQLCDGAGQCKVDNGGACSTGTDCASGVCTGAVCVPF